MILRGLRVAVNTQTPLMRLRDGAWVPTTGGVTRMLLPLLSRGLASGRLAAAHWIALGGEAAWPDVERDGLHLSFVGMPPDRLEGYAAVKEHLWALLNSNPRAPVPHGEQGIEEAHWQAFDAYQSLSARALQEAAARMGDLDLLYVHDFQQVGVAGAWQGPRVPKLFHLHTPFPSVLPPEWRAYIVDEISCYDAVVVSTPRYAANLRAAGIERPIHVIPPFIDPADYPRATRAEVDAFREAWGIQTEDRVILHVGRMDPVKGQDRLLRALPDVVRAHPTARLVLVGNGSFSSARRGGLGLSKGQEWRAHLESLARELGVAERVAFTGHLGERQLPAAYEASEVFCLPSTREGFGLAAIEAWRYRKPVIVSDRTGVAEHVVDDVNGLVVDCEDPRRLAAAIVRMLESPSRGRIGEQGLLASEVATVQAGERALERIVGGLLEEAPRAAA